MNTETLDARGVATIADKLLRMEIFIGHFEDIYQG